MQDSVGTQKLSHGSFLAWLGACAFSAAKCDSVFMCLPRQVALGRPCAHHCPLATLVPWGSSRLHYCMS